MLKKDFPNVTKNAEFEKKLEQDNQAALQNRLKIQEKPHMMGYKDKGQPRSSSIAAAKRPSKAASVVRIVTGEDDNQEPEITTSARAERTEGIDAPDTHKRSHETSTLEDK